MDFEYLKSIKKLGVGPLITRGKIVHPEGGLRNRLLEAVKNLGTDDLMYLALLPGSKTIRDIEVLPHDTANVAVSTDNDSGTRTARLFGGMLALSVSGIDLGKSLFGRIRSNDSLNDFLAVYPRHVYENGAMILYVAWSIYMQLRFGGDYVGIADLVVLTRLAVKDDFHLFKGSFKEWHSYYLGRLQKFSSEKVLRSAYPIKRFVNYYDSNYATFKDELDDDQENELIKLLAFAIKNSLNEKDRGRIISKIRHAQFKERLQEAMKADEAMAHNGGIDLSSLRVKSVQGEADGINFHIDPAQFAQLQSASGFVPVIVDIRPMVNLAGFLGISPERGAGPVGV